MGDFNYPRLADFGAAISGANKFLCQEVLEELDVRLSSVCFLAISFVHSWDVFFLFNFNLS
jgi:hypothetical protein